MGQPMVRRLLQAGHRVSVYNRTASKAEALKEFGALVMSTPQAAVENGECVILMLSDAAAIEQVLFAVPPERLRGRTVIQMGTIAVRESRDFCDRLQGLGADYLECPVLGSRKEARSGRLILMVGARPEQYREWRSFLKCFGPDPQYIGGVGQAAALKLALNQLIAALMSAFSVSLGMIQHAGVSIDFFMSILRQSALYAPTFNKKLTRLLKRDFTDPNFPVRHLLKDVDLIIAECRQTGISIGHLQGIRGILAEAVTAGLGDQDYSAMSEMILPQDQS